MSAKDFARFHVFTQPGYQTRTSSLGPHVCFRRVQPLVREALARRRGEDHHAVTLPNWTNRDLRRVVRSGLSALRVVPFNVAEAVLAHRQGGISATYDLHEYEDEKREALELWAQRLKSIVSPEPVPAATAKVVKLRGRRR